LEFGDFRLLYIDTSLKTSKIRLLPGMVVVHNYNPIHSEDRDQEEQGSRPAQVKSYQDPMSLTSQAWRHVPVVPVMWEVVDGKILILVWPQVKI
jgi:hypothetical protein